MMNIYERKELRNTKQERLDALDEATAQLLPKDILNYVIAEYLEDNEPVVVERLETFKMQPRQPMKELEQACNYYGCKHVDICHCACCGLCGILILPSLCVAANCVGTICTIPYDCVTCNKSRITERWLVRMMNRPYPDCSQRDCAKTDYRLKRSCWTDCAALCYDLTCGFDKPRVAPFREFGAPPADFTPRPQLNGPEAMWME